MNFEKLNSMNLVLEKRWIQFKLNIKHIEASVKTWIVIDVFFTYFVALVTYTMNSFVMDQKTYIFLDISVFRFSKNYWFFRMMSVCQYSLSLNDWRMATNTFARVVRDCTWAKFVRNRCSRIWKIVCFFLMTASLECLINAYPF